MGTKSVKVVVTGFADYLAGNVGKRMSLRIAGGPDEPELVQGALERMGPPPNGVASIRLSNGNLRVVAPSSIVEMSTRGLATVYTRTVPYPRVVVEFDVEKPGRVRFLTLETGAAWSGSYLVDLVGNEARLTGKAQIAVGSLQLENTDVQVLAGLPTLENTTRRDLVSGVGSLRDYLTASQSSYGAGPRDPFESLAQLLQEAEYALRMGYYNPYPYYGGSLGGAGAGGGAYGGGDRGGTAEALVNSPAREESLYSYKVGRVSLSPGDRLTRVLFKTKAPHRMLLKWATRHAETEAGPFSQAAEFQQIARLTNAGAAPWTAGNALVVKEGTPLATVTMPFTPVGSDADLKLGTVQDVLGLLESVEVSREKGSNFRNRIWTSVTWESKFTVENTRDQVVDIEIVHDFSGEIVAAEGAEVKAMATRLDAANRNMRVTWRARLPAKSKKDFIVRAKTLV